MSRQETAQLDGGTARGGWQPGRKCDGAGKSDGIGTKSTPATACISCASCTARSASPCATGAALSVPRVMISLGASVSAMPSVRSTSAKCTPLTPPLSGSVITIARVASSDRRNPSAEPVSGLAAPARTPIPTSVRAISTREPGSIRPSLASSVSVAAGSKARSNASPAIIRSRSSPASPNCTARRVPVASAKRGARSPTTALTPFAPKTRITPLATLSASVAIAPSPGHRSADHPKRDTSVAFSVMNSSSAGWPSWVCLDAAADRGLISPGSVTRSP